MKKPKFNVKFATPEELELLYMYKDLFREEGAKQKQERILKLIDLQIEAIRKPETMLNLALVNWLEELKKEISK